MANYSIHKDREPQDTIFHIQEILHDIGLFPVLNWTNRSYEGARSNRITLFPTPLGINGKGTDERYASASGYAELMERLSNRRMFMLGTGDDTFFRETGFREFPDEKDTDIRELVNDPDPFTKVTLPLLGFKDPLTQQLYLQMFSRGMGRSDDRLVTVPFADPVERKIQYLPIQLVHSLTASNGMAAGNTMEEAMVQGLSEIFERIVNKMLLTQEAVPPEIPDEAVKQYSFYPLIEQVRKKGRYDVKVLDCSLGRGWPVAGLCITDVENGTFGIKLGAHPSFAVAVERTLTEALQGRSMENFSGSCRAGSAQEAAHYNNISCVAKIGNGIYPATMFTRKPGWEYSPWTQWEGLDNTGFLKRMLKLLKDENMHPLFRDCSFFGFPACFIVIPGVSNIHTPGQTFYHEQVTRFKVAESWGHFPQLTEEEEKRMLRLFRFKENSVMENRVSYLSGRHLSDRYSLDRTAAFLSLKQGEYAQAKRFFEKLKSFEEDRDEKFYYSGMIQYAQAREMGLSSEEAHTLIKKLFRKDISSRICEETADMSTVMEKLFPGMNCYDCKNCEAEKTGNCQYTAVRDVLIRAAKAMKTENVSQGALLEELIRLYP